MVSGNRNWLEVNNIFYSIYFMGKSWRNSQCELCLAKSHITASCPLQGESADRQLVTPPQRGITFGSMRWKQILLSGYIVESSLDCAYNTSILFRLKLALKIFTALVDTAECIARRRSVQFWIYYLDDYLIVRLRRKQCSGDMQILLPRF